MARCWLQLTHNFFFSKPLIHNPLGDFLKRTHPTLTLRQLQEHGIADERLPARSIMAVMLKQLGYRLRPVVKAQLLDLREHSAQRPGGNSATSHVAQAQLYSNGLAEELLSWGQSVQHQIMNHSIMHTNTAFEVEPGNDFVVAGKP